MESAILSPALVTLIQSKLAQRNNAADVWSTLMSSGPRSKLMRSCFSLDVGADVDASDTEQSCSRAGRKHTRNQNLMQQVSAAHQGHYVGSKKESPRWKNHPLQQAESRASMQYMAKETWWKDAKTDPLRSDSALSTGRSSPAIPITSQMLHGLEKESSPQHPQSLVRSLKPIMEESLPLCSESTVVWQPLKASEPKGVQISVASVPDSDVDDELDDIVPTIRTATILRFSGGRPSLLALSAKPSSPPRTDSTPGPHPSALLIWKKMDFSVVVNELRIKEQPSTTWI